MSESELVQQFFQSPQPSAGLVPNLITHFDSDFLNAIVHINGAKAGIWNAGAPYDEEDRYQPFREGLPLKDWGLAYNQGELLQLTGYSNTLVFGNDTLIVDCLADEKVLAAAEQNRSEMGYQDLTEFPKLLQEIGWALVAVGGEEKNFGLFMSSDENRGYVRMLQSWCHDRGRLFYTVSVNQDELVLTAHPAPLENRVQAIREQGIQFIAKMGQWGVPVHELQPHMDELIKHIAAQQETDV